MTLMVLGTPNARPVRGGKKGKSYGSIIALVVSRSFSNTKDKQLSTLVAPDVMTTLQLQP
jgi:hypothetical protein